MRNYFLAILVLVAWCGEAIAQSNPVYLYDARGNPILSTAGALNVSAVVSDPAAAATGGAVPGSAQYMGANKGGALQGLLFGQQTMANSLGVTIASDQTNLGIDFKAISGAAPSATNSLPFRLTDGAVFYDARQIRLLTSSDQVTIANASLAITAASLPLPAGAATAANQATANTSLSAISGQLPVALDGSGFLKVHEQGTAAISAASLPLPTGAAVSAKQPALGTAGTASSDVITVQGIASMTALKVDGSAVTQPVSGTVSATQSGAWNITNISGTVSLPTGASTSALQTTANTSLATIATNSGKIPPNTTAAFSQTSVTTTASTISAPANAVRVMIQGDSTNTDCIRYRFDGTAATATVGVVAQPGQDSGQLDSGMSVSVAACSGTQKVNVQYLAQ